ncbi:aureocin A53 family class IId bacteriocin [Exiguobacterium sp. s191]|nr:aureocin A53 family class IId bacteriocin [Exiguobacterium sp. s191]
MATFLRLVAQLSVRGAKWAWANKGKVMDMIQNSVRFEAILRYIESKV